MHNRRDFMIQAASCSALLTGATGTLGAENAASASGPMRVLILGGTGYIGPHVIRAALERGHNVSAFIRASGNRDDTPAGVERLFGDRNGDLESIKNRDWDVVLDLATYGPAWVRSLGEALRGRVGHYTFISTVAVYDRSGGPERPLEESSPLLEYKSNIDPFSQTRAGKDYGPLKVLCEREAEKQFPGKALILRPCYIVGPGDPMGSLTYWVARMEKGGEVLAAGDPLTQINFIDVRDLAEWTVALAERGETGIINAAGPWQLTWGSMLKTLKNLAEGPIKLTWVTMSWLERHQLPPHSNLLWWPTRSGSAGALIVNQKARAKDLRLRPLLTTARDTLQWYKAQPAEEQGRLLLGVAGMGVQGRSSLQESMERERGLLRAWHEDSDDACPMGQSQHKQRSG